MLKWSARAFAMAAALQFGVASAQDADDSLIPPGPTGPAIENEAEAIENEAIEESNEALRDAQEQRLEAQEDLQESRQDAAEEVQDRREDAFEQPGEAVEEQREEIEREARFRPEGSTGQVDERIRAATANLDIDDETRSRYRWHNGEWWFKTTSGNWKYYRDSRWQDFDPTSYQSMNSGRTYGAPQAAYGAQQQYGASDGYYTQGGYYQSTRPYGAYRPNYDNYNRGYSNDGFNRGYGYNQGFNQYNQGFNQGFYGNQGYQGYNPATDRIQGYDNFGRPYSMSGDRYRGGVIGSEIGGRIGGSTGAIIGGALGAEAAD